MTWRDKFRPIVARVLADHEGRSAKEIKAALLSAWPASEPRTGWPYHIWRDEIARQTALLHIDGVTRAQSTIGRGRKIRGSQKLRRTMTREEARAWLAQRQLHLFGDSPCS